jgi:hypothetical protein
MQRSTKQTAEQCMANLHRRSNQRSWHQLHYKVARSA